MFMHGLRNAMFALSLVAILSNATPAFATQETDKVSCGPKLVRPITAVKKGLKSLFSGIGKMFKHDESDNDYVDDEPTDQFPIGG